VLPCEVRIVLVHDPLVSELLIKRELDLKPSRLGMGDGTVSNESDGYDPFAVFQAMADGPSSRELYGEFADLRAKASVHEGVHVGRREADGTTGDIPLDVTTWGPAPSFMTVNVEAAQRVLDNPEGSSSGYYERLSPLFGRSTIELDEPEHKEYRNLIAQAFTRKARNALRH
jgi:cytochrome P450